MFSTLVTAAVKFEQLNSLYLPEKGQKNTNFYLNSLEKIQLNLL